MAFKEGIYVNLKNEEYHKDPALSHSMMEHLLKTPAHFHSYISNPPDPTPAMIFGSAFHEYILEPHIFADKYDILGENSRRSKKAARPQISHADYLLIKGMAKSILDNGLASSLLSDGLAEVSHFWRHHRYGFMMKCRPDYRKYDVLVDIKTCRDASQEAFAKDIANFGYHRQADHYMQGCTKTGFNVSHFVIIAVEKKAPYVVAVYRISDEDVYMGHLENEILYERYYDWASMQKPIGYPEEIQNIVLPKWYKPLI